MSSSRDTTPALNPLVEQGLDAYRQGDLRTALGLWEQAQAGQPQDSRIRALVEFARDQLRGGVGTERFSDSFGDPSENTNPELAHETLERVLKAEAEAEVVQKDDKARPRRVTVVSQISALLAGITRPDGTPELEEPADDTEPVALTKGGRGQG